eukprot:Selendium_serpulae@DN5868_c0_g1_i1.p1
MAMINVLLRFALISVLLLLHIATVRTEDPLDAVSGEHVPLGETVEKLAEEQREIDWANPEEGQNVEEAKGDAHQDTGDLEYADAETGAAEQNAEMLDGIEEKYAAAQKEYTDAELDVYDQGWQQWELEQKIVYCQGLVQQHMHHHKETYQQIAEAAGTSKGIRPDDALRTLMFGSLLSCYFKVKQDEVHSQLSPERTAQIVLAAEGTPTRMSTKQMALLEKVFEKRQQDAKRSLEYEQNQQEAKQERPKEKKSENEKPEEEKKGFLEGFLGGITGKAFGFAVVGAVGAALYWSTKFLANMEEQRKTTRPTGKKLKNKKSM